MPGVGALVIFWLASEVRVLVVSCCQGLLIQVLKPYIDGGSLPETLGHADHCVFLCEQWGRYLCSSRA